MSLTRILHKLRRLKPNPIDAMTPSVEGLLGLPVEIWQEIFTEANKGDEYAFNTDALDPSSPPKMLRCEEPSMLADIYSWHRWYYAVPLCSVTRVCKAWYILANPLLWSHLRIRLYRTPEFLQNLYQTLEKNKSLAQHVTCIMIRGLGSRYNDEEIAEEMEKVALIQDVFPKLANLKMIVCPRSIVERVNWSIKPEVVYIYEKTFDLMRGGPLIYGDHFWHHASTLVLFDLASPQVPFYPSSNLPQPIPTVSPTFSRLINLSIRADNFTAFHHITTLWNFPVLRSLSIQGYEPASCAHLLSRVRGTLEALEILISFEAYKTTKASTIIMPKLRSLCLQVPKVKIEGNTIQWWLDYITAPRLRRLVFHHDKLSHLVGNQFYVDESKQPWQLPEDFLRQVDVAIIRYPTIQELGVVTYDLHHAFRRFRSGNIAPGWILDWKEVRRWCAGGIQVEVICSSMKTRWTYTPDSLEEMGRTAWD